MKTTVQSEVELVQRAADDLDAFGELVERYRGSIQRQCYSRVRDLHYAEDLAQETFIRAYLNLAQLKDPSRFPNWLRKIAANLCREFARSSARREIAWEEVPETGDLTAGESGFPSAALAMLPEVTRECVELFYKADMSYAEIAEALDATVASVKARLQRAKAVLRKEMADMAPSQRSAFTERVIGKLEQLRSRSPEERCRAAKALREALAEDEVENILEGFRLGLDVFTRTDPSIYPVEYAIVASKRYRSPRVRDGLIDLVLNHHMVEVRIKAAGALATQGDPAAIQYLQQAIDNPRTPREVLSVVKSTMVYLQTLEMPHDADGDNMRFRADVELAAEDKKTRVELLRRLKDALRDPDSNVRNQAIKALVELGDKRAVPAITKLLDDPVQGIRQAAAIALGDLRSGAALPALLAALDEWTGRDLQTVLVALHKIADRRALPALLRFLEGTRNGNLIVMAKNPIVEIITADDMAYLKRSISVARSSCGDEPVLLGHLDWLWVSALGKAGDERHIPDIAESLQSGRRDYGLFEALGRIGGDEALALVTQYLYAGPHDFATKVLMEFGERGRAVLREALNSDDPNVVDAACARIHFSGGDPPSVERLTQIAETTTDNRTRMHAKAALMKSLKSEAWENVRIRREAAIMRVPQYRQVR